MSTGSAAVPAGRAQRAPRPRGVMIRRAVNRLTLPVLMLLPAMVIIGALVGYPLVRTIYLSFTDTDLGNLIYGGADWVGLENFKEVFRDEHLRTSLVNTVVFGSAVRRNPNRPGGDEEGEESRNGEDEERDSSNVL